MLDNKLTLSKKGSPGKQNIFDFSVMNEIIFYNNYSAKKVNNEVDTIQIDSNEEIQKKHRNYDK